MTSEKTLCLNMIVKNEMANLDRCLSAVAPYIACWVIGDTGSTDGTQDFIRSFFAARNIPGELHSFPFHNFEQARNAALDHAYASLLAYDYLLLDDADMELVVEDAEFRSKLVAPCYGLLQRSGVTYWNARIVHRHAGARYRGVTHEYLALPNDRSWQQLHGVWYRDHASGSNRVEKFERDIRLLTEALEKEPDNARYWFYLAQSYRDAGQMAKAAKIYAKRAEMGGWDEEAWYARLQQARCLRHLGDEGGFLLQALAAFNQRVWRAEPLYDLARYYRDRSMHGASVVFSELGLTVQQPEQDTLFVEDFVYTAGLKEEYSIAANYASDLARKDRGFAACNWLALNRTVPTQCRDLARWNLFFYLKSASAMMPSFTAQAVGFTPPQGYHPSNPSVARLGEEIVLLQRAVNFTLAEDGAARTPGSAPIHTRNFLLQLDAELAIRSSAEILPPTDMPAPAFQEVQGFEDARLFAWRGKLWCSACVRELTPEGWCNQVLARVDDASPGVCRLTDWRVLRREGPRRHEKNWMPQVVGKALQFFYQCDPTQVVDEHARIVAETTPTIAAEQFRGGTQAIAFDHGWLALAHEVSERNKLRHYQHRFVWFDKAGKLRRVSRPFFFNRSGVEFAAGLAQHPDGKRLIISYGVDDKEAWIGRVDASDVRQLLDDIERMPSGALGTRSLKLSDVAPPNAAVPVQAATPPKRRIWLYIPYFGRFPNYFQLYLDSLSNNAEHLSVFLMTDNDLSGYRVPHNLVPIPMTLGTLREKAARFISEEFGIDVRPDALLKQPYKICDFRIIYPELFRDISDQNGVTEDDFVGWGDCDLIYGRFPDFLDMNEEYHVIGGFHGHLTAIRNIDSFRKLFRAVAGLPELLIDEKAHLVDETAFRKPLMDLLERNQYKMFYINRYFCDIVPECFFGLFRQDHAQRRKNFFDAYHPEKEIDHVYYDRDGRLTVVYDDQDSRQSIYCHLQKRTMSMDFDRYENGYYIREDAFRLEP